MIAGTRRWLTRRSAMPRGAAAARGRAPRRRSATGFGLASRRNAAAARSRSAAASSGRPPRLLGLEPVPERPGRVPGNALGVSVSTARRRAEIAGGLGHVPLSARRGRRNIGLVGVGGRVPGSSASAWEKNPAAWAPGRGKRIRPLGRRAARYYPAAWAGAALRSIFRPSPPGPTRSHSGGAGNVPMAPCARGHQSRDGGSIRPSRFSRRASRIPAAREHLLCSGASWLSPPPRARSTT